MTIEDIRRKHEGQKKIYTGTTLNAKANSILTTDDVDRLFAALDSLREEASLYQKEWAKLRAALDEANRKYERAYDCHGQACGACIACCAEIIYDLTIRKDMAREDGYRQGWEHCKQVQDSFNEATIAVSRKFQEDLLEILTIVENDNDPDWSKVQKVKGIMLKHHIEEDEEMYDG